MCHKMAQSGEDDNLGFSDSIEYHRCALHPTNQVNITVQWIVSRRNDLQRPHAKLDVMPSVDNFEFVVK